MAPINEKTGPPKSRRLFWRITGLLLLILAVAGAAVWHHWRHRLPAELIQDIRAGIAARNIADPDQRFQKFLETRYGPLSDRANREAAFLGFFNIDHIRAMKLLVEHSPPNMRQANIDASARWLAHYRESLSPTERAELTAQIQSPAGQAMLRQANAHYNSQDVRYRGQTVPVVSQMLKTVSSLQKP